jgi:hypothetical protein
MSGCTLRIINDLPAISSARAGTAPKLSLILAAGIRLLAKHRKEMQVREKL